MKIKSWLYGEGELITPWKKVDGRKFAYADFKEGRQLVFKSQLDYEQQPATICEMKFNISLN